MFAMRNRISKVGTLLQFCGVIDFVHFKNPTIIVILEESHIKREQKCDGIKVSISTHILLLKNFVIAIELDF